jgi:hypothetical protein
VGSAFLRVKEIVEHQIDALTGAAARQREETSLRIAPLPGTACALTVATPPSEWQVGRRSRTRAPLHRITSHPPGLWETAGGFWACGEIARLLAGRDFLMRYRRSVLGFV